MNLHTDRQSAMRGVKETKVAGQENDDPTRISISLLAKLRVTSMQSGDGAARRYTRCITLRS